MNGCRFRTAYIFFSHHSISRWYFPQIVEHAHKNLFLLILCQLRYMRQIWNSDFVFQSASLLLLVENICQFNTHFINPRYYRHFQGMLYIFSTNFNWDSSPLPQRIEFHWNTLKGIGCSCTSIIARELREVSECSTVCKSLQFRREIHNLKSRKLLW